MMKKISILFVMIFAAVCFNQTVCAESVTIDDVTYNYTVSEDGYACVSTIKSTVTGEVVIPDKLNDYTVISINSFSGISKAESIVMPDTVTEIGDFAFGFMENLKNVKLSQSLTSISYCAFTNCKELRTINIPASVTEIEASAFNYCEQLIHVSLSENIKSIGRSAFYACKNIKSINFPNGLTEIGPNAFFLCIKLENVLIPKSVTSIGECAFAQSVRDDMGTFPQYHYSRTYKNVRYTGTEEEWSKIQFGSYNTNLTNSTIKFNAPALFVRFTKNDTSTVFSVSAENLNGAVVALSGYSNNVLRYFYPGLAADGAEVTFTIPNSLNCDTIKVFAFENVLSFKPLCESTERVFNI